jgi:hypothetical protein
MWVYFRHSLLVADESNQSISYAANFGSCFLGFVFVRWSTSSRMSLLLTFDIVDDTGDDFDTADINDGDNINKTTSTNKRTPSKGWNTTEATQLPKNRCAGTQFVFFFVVFNADLPTIAFLRGGLWIFAMVAIILIDISIKKYGQRVR